MSPVSLDEGLEKILHEALKLRPGLPWKPQNIEDARAMGYLQKKAVNGDWNKPKCVSVTGKLKRIGDLKSTLTSDKEMQSL